MNFNDTPPTGRENKTIVYCRACEYECVEGVGPPGCPDCRARGVYAPLFFVAYEAGIEDEAARKVIEDVRQWR